MLNQTPRPLHSIAGPQVLFAILAALLVTSCDPGQSLRIENRSRAEATVKIIFSDANGYYDLDENSDADTLLIQLDTTNASREYHFGIGTWEINHALDTLAASIGSIEINSWKSTEIYKGQTQIANFLKSRLTGRYKECIEIILE